jgi:broad specificity phosphatase PhoE
MRHAERPALPTDGRTGDHVPLTEDGRLSARIHGEQLGPWLASVRSSPIRRARETAQVLLEGAARADLRVKTTRWLGQPGPFVAHPERAWKAYRALGKFELMRALVERDPALSRAYPGAFRAPEEALADWLDMMMPEVWARPGLHVAVSHDLIMAGIVGLLRGDPLPELEWPAFLDIITLRPVGLGPGREDAVELIVGGQRWVAPWPPRRPPPD